MDDRTQQDGDTLGSVSYVRHVDKEAVLSKHCDT